MSIDKMMMLFPTHSLEDGEKEQKHRKVWTNCVIDCTPNLTKNSATRPLSSNQQRRTSCQIQVAAWMCGRGIRSSLSNSGHIKDQENLRTGRETNRAESARSRLTTCQECSQHPPIRTLFISLEVNNNHY